MDVDSKGEGLRIKTEKLGVEETEKVRSDLAFIDFATQIAKSLGCRVVISGGYSIDGNLGRITRPHNDIDIQIFGANPQPDIVYKILEKAKNLVEYEGLKLTDKGRKEYYHAFFAERQGFGADMYYVTLAGDPFAETKKVVKSDGSETNSESFDTRKVSLEGIEFEAVSPKSQLEDIRKKRIRGEKIKPEHDQDLKNLETLIQDGARN